LGGCVPWENREVNKKIREEKLEEKQKFIRHNVKMSKMEIRKYGNSDPV
jgi:hypothetical protein